MKQKKILYFFLVLLWGCHIKTQKSDVTLEKGQVKEFTSEFASYISSLDTIPIPLDINPSARLPNISKKYNKKGFEKYKHIWCIQPIGIYYINNKTIGIIDYSMGDSGPTPFLVTYDLKGNKIDSTGFYNKGGEDIGYKPIEYITFKENKTIVVMDTVKRWDLNKDKSDIVESSMKITTGKVVYHILDNGKIKKSISSTHNLEQ